MTRKRAASPPARKPLRISNTLLAQDSSATQPAHGYRRHALTLPRVPFTVARQVIERRAPDSPILAMDDAGGLPYGGFLNSGGIGFGLFFPGYPYLAELAQRSEFRQPVETHAKDMTREWIEFKSTGKKGEEDKLADIELRFGELNVREMFRRALLHDGFYGLGHVFVKLRGQEAHELPLITEAVEKGSLERLINIEPMWTTPLVWNAIDPTLPDFYKPTSWMVLGRETHQSRLLRFISHECPDILKPAFNFGGVSLSQLIEPYVERWLKTVGSVNKLISNFSIINLQIDMSAVLEGGPDAGLIEAQQVLHADPRQSGPLHHGQGARAPYADRRVAVGALQPSGAGPGAHGRPDPPAARRADGHYAVGPQRLKRRGDRGLPRLEPQRAERGDAR